MGCLLGPFSFSKLRCIRKSGVVKTSSFVEFLWQFMLQVPITMNLKGSINNTSNSGGRKWKHIWLPGMDKKKLPRTKENYRNNYFPITKWHWYCVIQITNAQISVVVQYATLTWWQSSDGNIFCVTGPLCGEFTSDWWILLTKANDAKLWCFLWSVPELTLE